MADGVQAGLTPARQALAMMTRVRSWFVALAPDRRRWLLAGATMLVAAMAGMAWYAGRTDWRVLFSGLEGKDVQQVSQELAAAGITYEVTPDGTGVQVPAELLDKARMEVAAKGMPQTGRLGFELFDKPNWVGSEFDERVNYQRALEGELEHTIATLGMVRSARVHLVLPQQTLFAGEEKSAKASVVLKLKRSSLPPEQVEQIRNLVAGAVENLSPEQVTLVDADGRINLAQHGAPGTDAGDAEQAAEAKLVAMLEPLAGVGNVRATVNVAYDQGTEERTDEIYDPTQSAPLNLQKTEQTSGLAARASGVPGTASNSPAAAPTGAVQGSETAASPGTPPLLQSKSGLPVYPERGAGQTQSSKQENGTYAVSKHLIHTESGPGRLRRITAAVLVNDRSLTEGTGKLEHATWKARTPEEMSRLEGLARAAVGFDEKRGDSVVVENVSFVSNASEVRAGGMARAVDETRSLLATQPGILRTAVIGLVGVLLVWFVLRPVAGQVTAAFREPMLLGAGSQTVPSVSGGAGLQAALQPAAQTTAALSSGSRPDWTDDVAAAPVAADRGRPPAATRSGVYDQVAEHIRREPAQSTRLLEAWIGSETEGE